MKTSTAVLLALLLTSWGCTCNKDKEEKQAHPMSVLSTDEYKQIRAYLDEIPIFDGHEHLAPPKWLKENVQDFYGLVTSNYNGSDIKIIGGAFEHNKDYMDTSLSAEQRWASFEPIYERLRNTGYWRQSVYGIEMVHGITFTGPEDIPAINESIRRVYESGTVYEDFFRDKYNIRYSLVYTGWRDGYPEHHWNAKDYPGLLRPVRYIDWMVQFKDYVAGDDLRALGEMYDMELKGPDDLKNIYEAFVQKSLDEAGAFGFKMGLAYSRGLDFMEYDEQKCRALFTRLLQTKSGYVEGLPEEELEKTMTEEEATMLTNWAVHQMLEVINAHKEQLSIHTGLQTGGYNDVRNSNPQDLIPLFKKYPDIRFDIFHGSWPWMHEFIELAKSWPNVYLNLTWLPVITPVGAEMTLSEALEAIPVNKIFAYGGDDILPENALGQLRVTKEVAAKVLAQKVIDGRYSMDQAKGYALRIFYTNLMEFYGMPIDK